MNRQPWYYGIGAPLGPYFDWLEKRKNQGLLIIILGILVLLGQFPNPLSPTLDKQGLGIILIVIGILRGQK